MMKTIYSVLSLGIFAILSNATHATTGYFMHGYGVKAQGNAGTSIANFNDALTIASNPAGLSWIEQQVNVGATIFAPDRSSSIHGSPFADGEYDANGREYFVIPEVAYSHLVNDQVAVGFAIYGNGGMNTSYKQSPFEKYGSTGPAGVNLSQLFFSPAVAWKYAPNQSVAFASNIMYQQFEAKGIDGFAQLSQDSTNLSNRGKDSSTGIGFKLGWSGQFLNDQLTLGAKYSSKVKASNFDKYSGLFAENGGFDVPESYGVGVAFKLTPALTVAADVERINYSNVASVGNSLNLTEPLGTAQGAGFGWQDINIYKIGATYQATPKLTLRAGYSHNDQPIQSDQTFLNILAPGVVQDHLSLGVTWQLDAHQDVSIAYTHALEAEVNGQSSIPVNFGAGNANLKMNQNILGLAYSFQF
ncbi:MULTISPECIES: OmpP1/FadL family transporter [Acinetobacter]|uniref:Long-chain fatty acid transporter n=1 Tax=Acinetobacter chengduensis TaxID=2420890 RepID=A0ABX9TZ36_9GAMM|nr:MULTISPECIES: outer membrane protein transport protein [Acinetobacter]MBI1451219.1 outer membrane protein transport protein [Acinetobacter sp. FL51]RKG43681.1 long-chain fatty acid transporter [Acinetobacter sp. WCHAc060007]RLL23917.1 long-chain fatty acid transporter [Acinetobacter chengduensis]